MGVVMLKRFSWKKNDIHSIQLKDSLYIIAQLLESPYVAFFNITSESNNFYEKPLDLNDLKPFGVCMVLKDFFKKCSVGKVKDVKPNLNSLYPRSLLVVTEDSGEIDRNSVMLNLYIIW